MDVEIEPEPPEPVRKAILAALVEADDGRDGDGDGAWWRVGLEESVAGAPAQAGRPRSSRGAERA